MFTANQAPLIKINQTYFEVYIKKPFFVNASGFDIDGNITHFIVLTNVSYSEIHREQGNATHNATSTFKFIVADVIPITIGYAGFFCLCFIKFLNIFINKYF